MTITPEQISHIRHIHWVLSFCYTELERFMPGTSRVNQGQLEEWKHRLYEFIRDSELQGTDNDPYRIHNPILSPGEFLDSINNRTLLEVQNELRHALEVIADDHILALALGEQRFKDPNIVCMAFTGRFQLSIQFKSDPVGKALLALAIHVVYSRLTADRIRRCPVDRIIFIRADRKPQEGREAYCSRACKQAAATKKFLLRKAEAAAKRTERQVSEGLSPKEKPKTTRRNTKKR